MRHRLHFVIASVLTLGLAACDNPKEFNQTETIVTGTPVFNGKCTKVMIEKNINDCGEGFRDPTDEIVAPN